MDYTKEYTKEEAIKVAMNFMNEINKIEEKYSMSFNSDTGDIYLSFKSKDKDKYWDSISIGWDEEDGDGDDSIKVTEVSRKKKLKKEALSKLTDEEREVLGLE